MNPNLIETLVPPARIKLAAHGLGNKKPSNTGTSKDNEGFYYIK